MGEILSTKNLKESTIIRYEHELSRIAHYVPRLPDFSHLLPNGLDTEMEEADLKRFLASYQRGVKQTRHLRKVMANYMRRSFERLSDE